MSIEQYMNQPMESTYAYKEEYKGATWMCCPFCGKRAFTVGEHTTIHEFFYQCRHASCKKVFEVELE